MVIVDVKIKPYVKLEYNILIMMIDSYFACMKPIHNVPGASAHSKIMGTDSNLGIRV